MFNIKQKLEDIYKTVKSMSYQLDTNYFTKLDRVEKMVLTIDDNTKWTRSKASYMRTIEDQQQTIKMLTEVLCNKFEHGLFIVSIGGEFPMVIRDGKRLDDELTTGISISWSTDNSIPDIHISQCSTTGDDT